MSIRLEISLAVASGSDFAVRAETIAQLRDMANRLENGFPIVPNFAYELFDKNNKAIGAVIFKPEGTK